MISFSILYNRNIQTKITDCELGPRRAAEEGGVLARTVGRGARGVVRLDFGPEPHRDQTHMASALLGHYLLR